MKLEDIENLAKLLENTSLSEVTWQEGESSVTLKKQGGVSSAVPDSQQQVVPISAAVPAPPVAAEAIPAPPEHPVDESHQICSPMVGTFYSSPSPGDPPYVKVGDHIKKGQVLCIIEAMKLMNEIESDKDGEILEICLDNETPVEFNTVLFRLK